MASLAVAQTESIDVARDKAVATLFRDGDTGAMVLADNKKSDTDSRSHDTGSGWKRPGGEPAITRRQCNQFEQVRQTLVQEDAADHGAFPRAARSGVCVPSIEASALRAQAWAVSYGRLATSESRMMAELVVRLKFPAVFAFAAYAEAGWLTSYAASSSGAWRAKGIDPAGRDGRRLEQPCRYIARPALSDERVQRAAAAAAADATP